MDVQSVLLGFLMHDSMTGYDLKKAFSMSFSFFSGLSYGSIYPALKKMESQGLVSRRTEIQDGAPNRKVYTITDAGRHAFLDALRSPLTPDRPKSPLLMKLFFFAHLPPSEREAIVGNYLDSVEELSGQLKAARPAIEAHADWFQYQCFQFGLRFFEDLARNISKVIAALNEKKAETVK
jgi:DNA-binding PadR family transcriptional regulator